MIEWIDEKKPISQELKEDMILNLLDKTGLCALFDDEKEKRLKRIIENSGDDLLWLKEHKTILPFSCWLLDEGHFDELADLLERTENLYSETFEKDMERFRRLFMVRYEDYVEYLADALLWKPESPIEALKDLRDSNERMNEMEKEEQEYMENPISQA